MAEMVPDLLTFIDRSPTPYHAVAEAVARVAAEGFEPVSENALWDFGPGQCGYVVRGDGSLVAFQVGTSSPADAGFRILGAHTDSPNLRLKPDPDVSAHGYRQLAVEPYGGVLLHTWLDRDLSLAGRVATQTESGIQTTLIDFARPMLRIPNLAIHLFREIREKGLKLDAQKHMVPLVGLDATPPIRELLATELKAQGLLNASSDQILSFDLMLYDTQPSSVIGSRGEFISAPRLDNLASSHAAITSLIRAQAHGGVPFTRVAVLYDHEEVGSRSAQGAAGTFLVNVLDRIASGYKGGEPQAMPRAAAASRMISVDMAHAVHPNYPERHESGHHPVVGRGPVIKFNANQSYATDAETAGLFSALCRSQNVTPQQFVTRSDMACGSTIGPISASQTGIRTADVGNPMLAMHSCREMAGAEDVGPMIDVLTAFYTTEG